METLKEESNDLVDWQKPMKGREIIRQINEFASKNICYGSDCILGFPGTNAHPMAVFAYSKLLEKHPNNIGMHTGEEGKSEYGFQGTQEAERQVIAMVADLTNAAPHEVDGYISPGGTEANIDGCWIGREAYPDELTAIVCSHLTHYSVVKAANVLRIGIEPKENGTGLYKLGTDNNGHLLLNQLQDKLEELARREVRNIIVVANAGTTMLGSVDDIPGISAIILEAEKTFPNVNFHLHVDAAFGGFIIPFIDGLPEIGFSNPGVASLTIDIHKMGLAPYGSGIILARKGLFQRIKTDAPYVPGNDMTLCGSRPGAMALSCWALMKSLGKDGYVLYAKQLVELTAEIAQRLRQENIPIFDPDINIIAVKKMYPFLNKGKNFLTHEHKDLICDLEDPECKKKTKVWNIVVMHHTTMGMIDKLLKKIKEC